MAEEQYFMGLDGFIWFVGVVENRNDPAELGRVQVRCLGYHTEDLTSIPTADLPWAHVMHPVTDPAVQGLGNTPSFLVEGTWVIGFFRDAREKQQPVVMGTLPGYPQTEPNTAKGFNDPTGTYPNKNREFSGHSLDESDVSRLARGKESENHDALKLRRAMRQTDVPIAVAPYNSLTDNTQEEPPEDSRDFFSEPHPKGIESDANPYTSSAYPYNHVHESESGHIHEIDDSPGSERLLRQHSAGTFEEIHPDGSRVVKVVFDDYKFVAGESNAYIEGGVNLTVNGDVNHLVKGNYNLEVQGDYSVKVGRNQRVKVGGLGAGNLYEEIVGNRSVNIDRTLKQVIGVDSDTLIGGDESRQLGGKFKVSALEGVNIDSGLKSLTLTSEREIALTTGSLGSIDIKAGTTLSMAGVAVTQLGGLAIAVGDITTTTISLSSNLSVNLTSPTFNIGVSAITAAQAVLASDIRAAIPCVINHTGVNNTVGAVNVVGPLSSSISVAAPAGLFIFHTGAPH